MQKHQIHLRPGMSQSEIQNTLRSWAKGQNAEMRPMGRLVRRYKSEGENMHWHLTGLRTGMGTVEATYLPSNGLLTVLVHDNRRGFWAGKAFGELAVEIMSRFEPKANPEPTSKSDASEKSRKKARRKSKISSDVSKPDNIESQ